MKWKVTFEYLKRTKQGGIVEKKSYMYVEAPHPHDAESIARGKAGRKYFSVRRLSAELVKSQFKKRKG